MTEKEMKDKWAEVLDFATEHVTKKGLHTGIKWLEDSFNEYLAMTEKTASYGIGGQPGSLHNRQVLAERIVLALGPFVGGRHVLDEQQLTKLKDSLKDIVNNDVKLNQIKR
ncbi:MAG: hypothetical protein ACI3Y0_05050 [Prevotella sp.]